MMEQYKAIIIARNGEGGEKIPDIVKCCPQRRHSIGWLKVSKTGQLLSKVIKVQYDSKVSRRVRIRGTFGNLLIASKGNRKCLIWRCN